MHQVLDQIEAFNLKPAIQWTKERRADVDTEALMGLEFKLHRLQVATSQCLPCNPATVYYYPFFIDYRLQISPYIISLYYIYMQMVRGCSLCSCCFHVDPATIRHPFSPSLITILFVLTIGCKSPLI
jgi:hypothetical protein